MRTNFLKPALALITFSFYLLPAFAQSPEKMSYQAVIRNPSGQLVVNSQIGMQVSILQGSVGGSEVYKELHNPNPQTNANGLVTIEIGSGIPLTGIFAEIDWSNGPYFIKTETDPTGGTNYTITGTSQLLSVPYALHAKTADSLRGGIVENDPVFSASVAAGITGADTAGWAQAFVWGDHAQQGYLTQELQVLSISNDTIFLTGGSFAIIPAGFSGNYNDLTNQPNFPDSVSMHGFTGNYHDLTNKPVLSTVATSGSFTDLSNQPTLWDSTYASIKGSPALAPVATSGNYHDLTNKPNLSTVATTGNYFDLSSLPNIADSITAYSFSGDYHDLDNKPLTVSAFINDAGYLTSNEYQTLSINNDTIFLTNGGFVRLPNLAGALRAPTVKSTGASNVQSFETTINATVNPSGLVTNAVFEWGEGTNFNNSMEISANPLTGESELSINENLVNLQSATTYYYRIKATNASNMAVSNDTFFTTLNSVPIISTNPITTSTATSVIYAISGGDITWYGGSAIISRGVCWSMSPNPTVSDSVTIDGNGIGIFSSTITGISWGNTYYVRAYATNSTGTGYGQQLTVYVNELMDPRDSNHYDVVKIGNQVWMAENLKYLPSVIGSATGSLTTPYYYVYGYNGTDVNAAKATANYTTYGVLYNWRAAMSGQASSSANPSGVQGVCPTGWHLPSDDEWTELENYLADNGYNYDGTIGGGRVKIGKAMASANGWNSHSNTGAVGNTDFPTFRNKSGFTALPGGGRYPGGHFDYIGDKGAWWSSTESISTSTWNRELCYNLNGSYQNYFNRERGHSVRCVKD